MKLEDLTGKRFGKWTVLKRAPNIGHYTLWECKCDCGKIKNVYACHLKSGKSPSCGCTTRSKIGDINRTHSKSNTRLYHIYCGIHKRCYNENSSNYHIYGKRDIAICDEWKNDFMSFYNWSMSHGYADNLTIDRIDNDKGYSPDNCRWATNKEQSNNTRRTIQVEYNGHMFSIKGLSEYLNLNYSKLYKGIRIKKLDIESAIKYAKTYTPRKEE